ncbi:hypothetical protein SHKM778_52540 [Streptomyces sp. KM77-8]|uniref:DUF1232 domain-containing protein n=1 Tax=Streptomyces haneummycinicus TaxID=3074435 RepID=A0AAT9HNK7_9ACTN
MSCVTPDCRRAPLGVLGAVLYLVLPADLLPDPVYLDDMGVLLLALRTMRGSSGARAPGTHLGRGGRRPADDYAP